SVATGAFPEVLPERRAPEQPPREERADDRREADRLRDERVEEGDRRGDDETAVLEPELHALDLDEHDHLPEEVQADGHADGEEREGRRHENAESNRVELSPRRADDEGEDDEAQDVVDDGRAHDRLSDRLPHQPEIEEDRRGDGGARGG